jgi:glycerol kinase
MWDRASGEPVSNAIVWQDRRTAAYCDELRARDGLEEKIRTKTGLVVDPYFSGTKVRWMLENVPGLRSRAEHGEIAFGTIDSWLVWRLTGPIWIEPIWIEPIWLKGDKYGQRTLTIRLLLPYL